MKKINTIKNVLIAAAIVSLGFSGSAFAIKLNGGMPQRPVTPPPVSQNDIVYGFQKDQDLKLIAPTDIKPFPNANFNLAGTQTLVNPLEKTTLVNTIATNNSVNKSAGEIAVSNSQEHMIASNGLVPVGAARKVNDNNEFQTLGAAYKINNKKEDTENYDFVISEPILK